MANEREYGEVDFIVIGTIGPPGQRVFYFQAGTESELLTLILEKAQSALLSESIIAMLEEIEEQHARKTGAVNLAALDLDLREPILPQFRVSQMALGYNPDRDLIVLAINELQTEDTLEEPQIVRLFATRDQMKALAEHTRIVVESGRPICGNCGQPMDPDGHFCPQSNGHRKSAAWA